MARFLIHDGLHPRLAAALQPLEGLIDWERRDRSAGAGMRVDLAASEDLSERLGRPSAAFGVVHVTGTKGKGSTVALVEAGLLAAGLRAGAYLSPHVERVTERVRVAGASIDDEELAAALEQAWAAREAAIRAGSPAREATWFDVFTNAAFSALRAARVEWAVVEVGIGGRLDSTNVVHGDVCVITNVALEHTALLGATRAAIAREKSGILERGCELVTGLPADDEAGRVVAAAARALDVNVRRPARRRGATDDTTAGAASHAEQNAELAGLALDALGERGVRARGAQAGRAVGGWLLDPATRARARLPARGERFELDGRALVIDGAHVPASLSGLLDELARAGLATRPVVVLGLGRDKDAAGMLKALVGRVDRVLCTSVGEGPYQSASDLAETAGALGLVTEAVATPQEALDRALAGAPRAGWVLVTGSLHLAGAVRPLVTRTCSRRSSPTCS
jgi:dihydrofolate synthase/folylpolyglutamate synthase